VYFKQSQRIMVVAQNFEHAAEALDELRMRVRAGEAEKL
jgi:hypothetical protein